MKHSSVPIRLAAFVAALLAALGIGVGLGAALGPDAATTEPAVPVPTSTHEMDH